MSRKNSTVKVDEIKQCPLFQGLQDEELKALAELIRVRYYQNGEIIVQEGDIGEEMFILLDGALELSQKLTLFGADAKDLNSKDKMLNRLNATSRPFVGEMSLFEEHSIRSATMKALGNVTVGVIDKEKLLHLIQGNHHLGFTLFYNIGMALSARLKKANQDILKLTTAFSLALERGW